jgi:hypothetical protein
MMELVGWMRGYVNVVGGRSSYPVVVLSQN